ncbi:MAG: PPOX class F420-dependent oxidoreductase [Candidatus Thorarchaeota archaeon]
MITEIVKDHKHINLTTFKKDGTRISCPVWFVLHEGKLFLMSGVDSWKVKRMRSNPNVEFAPSKFGGKEIGKRVKGTVRFLGGEEAIIAQNLLRKRYPIMWILVIKIRDRGMEYLFFEITPQEIIS